MILFKEGDVIVAEQRKFDPRTLMKRAIDVMKKSVGEPRDDDKANPLVGAVLVKPDGGIETAHRGELRYGDHAEFTLLERKNRHSLLEGSSLFSTLEPCAPGARRHPKLSCSERIMLARIKEVWVGLADPDPTVDRKGIAYLEKHGIKVHMFDRDLQEEIQEHNREFIRQAQRRAAEAEKQAEVVQLSEYEVVPPAVVLDDLEEGALTLYAGKMGIPDSVSSPVFHRRLVQQGVLKESEGAVAPTGFGLMLFGKHARSSIQHAGLLATVNYPNGDQEKRDFSEAMVLVPDLLEEWLKKTLALTMDRSSAKREDAPDVPFEVIREGVVNALIHRDYGIAGAKCHLLIDEHSIVIRSPGLPQKPITLEQMQDLSAPMLSRNPVLHFVFAQMDLAEERGLGMATWRGLSEKHHLPLPRYSYEAPYLVLTIGRSMKASAAKHPELSAEEKAGLIFLASQTSVTRKEYVKHTGMEDRTAQRHLQHFMRLHLVERIGSGRATRYRVTEV